MERKRSVSNRNKLGLCDRRYISRKDTIVFSLLHSDPVWRPPKNPQSKVKIFLCLTNYALRHEDVWGSGYIYIYIQVFLTSALVGDELSASHPLPLYPRGKSLRYPLDRRLSGSQSRSRRCGEEKILDNTGTRTLTPRPSGPLPCAIQAHNNPRSEYPN
jgi:hypothetical protein